MVRPLTKLALDIPQTEIPSTALVRDENAVAATQMSQLSAEFLRELPCVLYDCDFSLETSFVSPNVFDLIGVRSGDMIGRQAFWDERIPQEDRQSLSDKLVELETTGAVSLIHRIIGESGLPIWVCHSLCRVKKDGVEFIRGCVVPMHNEKRVQSVDPGVISRFVHKLGNQFQLLNLVINSLRKGLPDSRETEILQQAVEKSIELARAFSDFSQPPAWMSNIDLAEILRAACVTKRSAFMQKGVRFDETISSSFTVASVYGDPFLLEVALSHVLQNALEATDSGGNVELHADLGSGPNHSAVAKLTITDSGCGIAESNLENVLTPFFTSKKDHEGLGLSMAARFVELHGGLLRMTSAEGKGTRVEIMLPTVHSASQPDF